MSLPSAAEEAQMNRHFRVAVRDGFDQFTRFHFNPQFFHQLPAETVLKGFAWLALAAREFPQAAQMPARRPLRDKESALTEDKARGDFDDPHAWRFLNFAENEVD
jgi:hypothetical protein